MLGDGESRHSFKLSEVVGVLCMRCGETVQPSDDGILDAAELG